MPRIGIVALALLGACHSSAAPPPAPAAASAETLSLLANGLHLKTNVYRGARLSDHPRLVIVLHGDAPFEPPSYQYAFARRAAAQLDDVVAAAILRPGYTDDTGARSDGERGETTGDNYTPEVVDAIAQAIEQLKTRFHPSATIIVGHSGGAAISADLLGRAPAEVDAALLVSCPCDLGPWRKHMHEIQGHNPIWLAPVKSLSPMDLAPRVPPSVRVRMLVGSADPVTPPELTQRYAAALREHHVDVNVTSAPGLQHNILLEPVTLEELRALLQRAR